MTNERIAIEQLARCRFLPGSFDKRFARSLNELPESARLTAKQRALLWKLVRKYRRQMSRMCVQDADAWLNRREEVIYFEQQIDADPSDYGIRGIYADWLEENDPDGGIGGGDFCRLAQAQRWMVENKHHPFLTPCGQSYGPSTTTPINFEWTFGMDVWRHFVEWIEGPNQLPYYHKSREEAEANLAKALVARNEVIVREGATPR